MTYRFEVSFDEIDTENWSEKFTVTAPKGIDEAWDLAEEEADRRGHRFGHRHEWTLSLLKGDSDETA